MVWVVILKPYPFWTLKNRPSILFRCLQTRSIVVAWGLSGPVELPSQELLAWIESGFNEVGYLSPDPTTKPRWAPLSCSRFSLASATIFCLNKKLFLAKNLKLQNFGRPLNNITTKRLGLFLHNGAFIYSYGDGGWIGLIQGRQKALEEGRCCFRNWDRRGYQWIVSAIDPTSHISNWDTDF